MADATPDYAMLQQLYTQARDELANYQNPVWVQAHGFNPARYEQLAGSVVPQLKALLAGTPDPNYVQGSPRFEPGTPNYNALQWAQYLQQLNGGTSPSWEDAVANFGKVKQRFPNFDPGAYTAFVQQYPEYGAPDRERATFGDEGLLQEIGLGSEFGPALALLGAAVGGAGYYGAFSGAETGAQAGAEAGITAADTATTTANAANTAANVGKNALTLQDVLRYASLANTAAGVGTKIAQGGGGGNVNTQGGGSSQLTNPDGSINYGALLGILGTVPGLVGSGIALAGQGGTQNRLNTYYNQGQQQYQQQLQQRQLYQQLLDFYNTQQQNAYAGRLSETQQDRAARQAAQGQLGAETAEDRALRQQSYQQQLSQVVQDYAARQQAQQRLEAEQMQDRDARRTAYDQLNAETMQDRAARTGAYQTATQQVEEDRAGRGITTERLRSEIDRAQANNAATLQARNAIAGVLADPRQVLAGGQSMYQPMEQATENELLRGVMRGQALRGTGDAGVADYASAQALAPYLTQLRQQGMGNFLASQQAALGGYQYAPAGPLDQYAPQGPYAPIPQGGPYTAIPQGGPYTSIPQGGPYAPSYQGGPYTSIPQGGPYTPDAPQPAGPAGFPNVPSYIPGSNTGPQVNDQAGFQGLSSAITQLGKILSPTDYQRVLQILSQQGGQNALTNDPYGSRTYPSFDETMPRAGYEPDTIDLGSTVPDYTSVDIGTV